MEKFELYNKAGQVDDPRVAKVMAEREDRMRKNREQGETDNTQEYIDQVAGKDGEREQYDLMLEDVATKIRESLSPEEMAVIKKLADHNSSNDMEILVRKIVK